MKSCDSLAKIRIVQNRCPSLAAVCLLQAACGGGKSGGGGSGGIGGTPAGIYTITVKGTAGSVQHMTNVALTVQ